MQKARLPLLLAIMALWVSCSSQPPKGKMMDDEPREMTVGENFLDEILHAEELAVLRVKEGEDQPPAIERMKTPETRRMSAADTDRLFARVPAIESAETAEFALREASQPAPKTGEVISATFPPEVTLALPDDLVSAESEEFAVARFSPEGKVDIAAQISLTFNRPMVAVTSHDDAAAEVPVVIEPSVPGTFRWVGARTLFFEATGPRLPMATSYEVRVPRGTASATGDKLSQDFTFSFQTPAPRVQSIWPSGGTHAADVPILLTFDQLVDPEEIARQVSIKTGLLSGMGVRVITQSDLTEKYQNLKTMIESAEEGRWVLLRPERELPLDSNIRVTLTKGTPSGEGPLTTPSDQSFNFKTYGAMQVTEHGCGWRECQPASPFTFQFSNALDMSSFDPTSIEVTPEIPGMRVHAGHHGLSINGLKKGRTRYTVTLPALQDVFGQTLEGNRTFRFRVESGPATFRHGYSTFTVVDPAGSPALSTFTTNWKSLHVVIHRVTPSEWDEFRQFRRSHNPDRDVPPGQAVFNEVISVEGGLDELAETKFELGAHTVDGAGMFVVLVTPNEVMRGVEKPRNVPRLIGWFQVSDIALDAWVDDNQLYTLATSLTSGAPLAGVDVDLHGISAKTDASGLVRFELPTSPNTTGVLRAKKGNDVAILPEDVGWHQRDTSWKKTSRSDQIRWFVFDDRHMYRPGESVHVKGWVRRIAQRVGGDVEMLSQIPEISYKVSDARGNEFASGHVRASELGGFDLAFDLPSTPNLGHARVQLTIPNVGSYTHTFQIQEFRTPEFEVTASMPPGPFLLGDPVVANVKAAYYAGGGLAGAPVSWSVSATPSSFTPPNQGRYAFGFWTPWWVRSSSSTASLSNQHFEATTDAAGMHKLEVSLTELSRPRPFTIRAQATVTDVNRQAWTSTATTLVHPSTHYVGLRTERYFVDPGKPMEVEYVVADIDGNLVSDRPVELRMVRQSWVLRGGSYETEYEDEMRCTGKTSADGKGACTFTPEVGGSWELIAWVEDDEGRRNLTRLRRWVSGGTLRPVEKVEREDVQLIPNQDSYQPGETAEILVQSPFAPAEGVVTIRRFGLVETRRITLEGSSTSIKIPIKEGYIPNIHVHVDLVGTQARTNDAGKPDPDLPPRPAFAGGGINLPVPPTQRVLAVSATPARSALGPGESTDVVIAVRDANGKAVEGAEVALVVVDEAILALSSYQMADPIRVFYDDRPGMVRSHFLRQHVVLTKLEDLEELTPEQPVLERSRSARGASPPRPSAAPMELREEAAMDMEMAPGGDAGQDEAIAVRADFNPLAAFHPAGITDENGNVTVDFKLPDNLTRYRVMAVATSGARTFGVGESAMTARLPLMVRPSPPRFLNFSDEFELPVVLQNQTDELLSVELATRASNVDMKDQTGWVVEVPAQDRVEVRFPAAAMMAGRANFQVVASTEGFADAASFHLPVWTPATSEAFATYGAIDAGAIRQPVQAPTDVWPQFGGIEVSTSSTAVQSLTDAFLYLYHYPYACSEQIASRIISVVALQDVLHAFEVPDIPTRAEIARQMESEIRELASRQNNDGGFGLWRPWQTSFPFASLHVIHALKRAEAKGYDVPEVTRRRSDQYLQNIDSHIPATYSPWARNTVRAYALYVRAIGGDKDARRATQVFRELVDLEKASVETLGWLLYALSDEPSSDASQAILRHLQNRVSETASTAEFRQGYSDGHHLIFHSSRRADAVVLEALMAAQPRSDLILKLVTGLQAHRKRGHWGNTQENGFVLLALDQYFAQFESDVPNFTARAWLGETFAGSHRFRGRTTETHQIDIPMQWVVDRGAPEDLTLQKDGRGRMYYRIGMRYAPRSLDLEPVEHGFAVERMYEGLDDPDDVKRRADGSWEFRAGARIRVKLTMAVPARRYHVALVDPMPAGVESLNAALAVTGDIPQESTTNRYWWWSRPWYEHQNLRDERTEAFASLVWGGVYEYVYYTRATTPGNFVVPPARAEEMYAPETFGRSSSDRVRVVVR